MKVYAGTGHRPKRILIDGVNAHHPFVYERLVSLATAALERDTPDEVLSGMALGWDMALADAALTLGIPYAAYIPFISQSCKWLTEDQRHWEHLVYHAHRVVIVCEGDYAKWKLMKRNERLVDDCNKVLALWDGEPKGGTYQCLHYAHTLERPIWNLWPSWMKYGTAR